MEKEKFDLQKKHTENIQKLLEDTNSRLNKMEAEYLAQTKATVSIMSLVMFVFPEAKRYYRKKNWGIIHVTLIMARLKMKMVTLLC